MQSFNCALLQPAPYQIDIYLRDLSEGEVRSVAESVRKLSCAADVATYRDADGSRWLRVAAALSRCPPGPDLLKVAVYIVDALGLGVDSMANGIVQGCAPAGLLVPLFDGLLNVDRALALAPAIDMAIRPLTRA